MRWTPLLLAFVLAVTGCSSDSTDEAVEPYAAAIAETFDPTPDRSTGQVGRCFADELVAYLGRARLEAFGTPDEVVAALVDDEGALGLSATEADGLAEAFVDCGPDISRGIAADVLDDYGVDEIEQPGCISEAGRPLAVAFYSAAFVGEEAAVVAFSANAAELIARDLLGCGARLVDDMRAWLVDQLDDAAGDCAEAQVDDDLLARVLAGRLAPTEVPIETLFADCL